MAAKPKRLARLRDELRANLFVGAFFAQKTKDTMPLVPVTEDINRVVKGMASRPGVDETVAELADITDSSIGIRVPEVFHRGWFDVVLGNPRWEVSQVSEEEYFSTRLPSVALLAGERRKEIIRKLAATHPAIWQQYQSDLKTVEAANTFIRSQQRFEKTAVGKLNTYSALCRSRSSDALTPRASRFNRADRYCH